MAASDVIPFCLAASYRRGSRTCFRHHRCTPVTADTDDTGAPRCGYLLWITPRFHLPRYKTAPPVCSHRSLAESREEAPAAEEENISPALCAQTFPQILMAVIRERIPHLALRLELPPKDPLAGGIGRRVPAAPPGPQPLAAAAAACSEYRLADLEKVQVLGHGNGGTVYKVRHARSGAIFALKLLHPHQHSDATIRRQNYREIEILRRTDSPFVVRCHSLVQSGAASGDFALLLEYMDAGTLDSLLRRRNRFPEAALAEVARQVLQGLAYLHSQKIVHRDIKPSNLLVNRSGEIKISDFGVAKIMARSLAPCDSYVGTCAYMSPERFDPGSNGGSYDGYAGDVWSLGLTILELYLGRFPLLQEGQRPDWAALMCAICFGELPSVPDSASDELKAFVTCCLQREADKRWSVERLLSHPFLSRYQSDSAAALKKLLPEP